MAWLDQVAQFNASMMAEHAFASALLVRPLQILGLSSIFSMESSEWQARLRGFAFASLKDLHSSETGDSSSLLHCLAKNLQHLRSRLSGQCSAWWAKDPLLLDLEVAPDQYSTSSGHTRERPQPWHCSHSFSSVACLRACSDSLGSVLS